MPRRTRPTIFRENLSAEEIRLHVAQMAEVRSYVTDRSRELYPLSDEHQAFADLNAAIDKHIEFWTGNAEFCYSGHQAGVWRKEPNNDNDDTQ